jgi:hypothetical protein
MRSASLVLVLALGGCASFRSVRATASLADDVGAAQHTLDNTGAYCRFLEAAGTHPAQPCAVVEADQRSWQTLAARLAGYGAALRRMADDDDTRSIEDDLARATLGLGSVGWHGLSGDQAAGLASAINALGRAISTAYRRRALADTIRATAPHVRTLVAAARGQLALQLDNLTTLATLAEGTGSAIVDVGPAPAAGRLAAAQLGIWVRDQTAVLRHYDEALDAFGQAHERLAGSVDQLIPRDQEIYTSIVDSVKTIYEGGSRALDRGDP